MKRGTLITLVLLALVATTSGASAAGPAFMGGCGDSEGPHNMVAPQTLRPALLRVFLRAHPALREADVVGPLRGRTYYGMRNGAWYAVATFQVAGKAMHPSVFWEMKKGWKFVRDTHGGVATWAVPSDLTKLWGFRRWRQTNVYIPPR